MAKYDRTQNADTQVTYCWPRLLVEAGLIPHTLISFADQKLRP